MLDALKHDTEIIAHLNGKFDWIQIFVKTKAEAGCARARKPQKP